MNQSSVLIYPLFSLLDPFEARRLSAAGSAASNGSPRDSRLPLAYAYPQTGDVRARAPWCRLPSRPQVLKGRFAPGVPERGGRTADLLCSTPLGPALGSKLTMSAEQTTAAVQRYLNDL